MCCVRERGEGERGDKCVTRQEEGKVGREGEGGWKRGERRGSRGG